MSRQAMRCAAGIRTPPKNGPNSVPGILELQQNPAVAELREYPGKAKTVTLLFAAKDNLRNNAVVLRAFLEGGTVVKES
jgi:hypothetical protein